MTRLRALRERLGTVLGIPTPAVLVTLLVSALLGLQLSMTLEHSTTGRTRQAATAMDPADGAGKNASGLPVVTETTLGAEVQRLVDSGSIQPMTTFDAAACLNRLGIEDSILIMEEIAWGGEETAGWLLIHGPMDRETLSVSGGVVSATVVTPACGTPGGDQDQAAQDQRLWSGDVMIGSL